MSIDHVTSVTEVASSYFGRNSKTTKCKSQAFRISHRIILDVVAFAEILIIFLCAYFAKTLYIDTYLVAGSTFSYYVFLALLTSLVSYLVLKHFGCYELKNANLFPFQPGKIFTALLLAFLITISVLYFAKISDTYSRVWLALWFTLSVVSLVTLRYVFSSIFRQIFEQGGFRKRIIVIGSDQWANNIISSLKKNTCEYECVSELVYSSDHTLTAEQQKNMISDIVDHVASLVQMNAVDQIVIALSSDHAAFEKTIFTELRFLNVNVDLVPEALAKDIPIHALSHVNGLNSFSIQKKPITDWGVFLKSFEDYLLSAVFLVLAFIPMLFIALLIKLDSRGPVFFVQRRHGLNGKIIPVIKFRTMTVMEDGHQVTQASKNDARVTRIGAVLRRLSLDELPQLWNVLKGDMSLVGPRPHAMTHDHYYSKFLEIYANRQQVKPGITGWAQIHGLRGETKTSEQMRERVDFDIQYIDNWSLWLDLKILAATFVVGFVSSKAY